jgi:hypothetical protein
VNFPLVRVPLPKNDLGKIARNLVFTNKDLMAFCTSILLDVPYDIPEKNGYRLEPFRRKSRPKFGALWGTALRAPPRRRPSTGVDRITRPSSWSHRAIVSAGRNRSHSRGFDWGLRGSLGLSPSRYRRN